GSMILPQMEQGPLHNAINFGLTMTYPDNFTAQLLRVNSDLCPPDSTEIPVPVRNQENTETIYTVGCGNYVGMYGQGEIGEAPGRGDGIFYRNSHITFAHLCDGSSQTLAIG